MAAQTALTLATRVYNPFGTQNGVSTWRYPNDVVFNGISTVTQSVRGPSKEGVLRIQHKLDAPRVKGEDSPCGCTGELIDGAVVRVEAIIPAAWTKAQRQEVLDRLQSLVASTEFTAAYDDLEGAW